MITDKVGGSSAKPEVSKQSKEKRLKHKVSGYKSQSKRRSIAGCRLLLRTLRCTKCSRMKQNTDKTLTVKQNNFVALSPLSVFYLLQTLLCLSSLSLSKSLHLEHYMHNHIKSCQVSGHTSPFSFQHTDTLNAPVLKPPLIARVLKHTRDIWQHSKST